MSALRDMFKNNGHYLKQKSYRLTYDYNPGIVFKY